MGICMGSFELFFDDFFVPAANVLGGDEGEDRALQLLQAVFARLHLLAVGDV